MVQPFWPNSADASDLSQARPDTQDIRILQDAIRGIGVVSGCEVTEQSPTAQGVLVAAGVVRALEGYTTPVTGGNVALSAAHATLDRFDMISVNPVTGVVSATAGTEVPAASVSAIGPVYPVATPGHVVLAYVIRKATVNTITNALITDKQKNMHLVPPRVGGVRLGQDLITGNNKTFLTGLGDWTDPDGAADFHWGENEGYNTRYNPNSVNTLYYETGGVNQGPALGLSGTFLAGHKYAIFFLREIGAPGEVQNMTLSVRINDVEIMGQSIESPPVEISVNLQPLTTIWIPGSNTVDPTLRIRVGESGKTLILFVCIMVEILEEMPLLSALEVSIGEQYLILDSNQANGDERGLFVNTYPERVNLGGGSALDIAGSGLFVDGVINSAVWLGPRALTADVEAVNTTLRDANLYASLSENILLLSSQRVKFKFIIFLLSDGATEGVKFALLGNNGLTVSSVIATVNIDGIPIGRITVFGDGGAIGTGLASGNHYCEITGSMVVTAIGELMLRFAQNAAGAGSGVHVQVGSYMDTGGTLAIS